MKTRGNLTSSFMFVFIKRCLSFDFMLTSFLSRYKKFDDCNTIVKNWPIIGFSQYYASKRYNDVTVMLCVSVIKANPIIK